MVATTSNDKVDFVLQQIETMVASEGGTLELVSIADDALAVHYIPGVNEECPECVPSLEQVTQFLTASLQIHAPEIASVEVS